MTAEELADAFDTFEQEIDWPKDLGKSPYQSVILNKAIAGVAQRDTHANSVRDLKAQAEVKHTAVLWNKISKGVAENSLRGLRLYRDQRQTFSAKSLADHVEWFSREVAK